MIVENALVEIPADELNKELLGWTNSYYLMCQDGYFLPSI